MSVDSSEQPSFRVTSDAEPPTTLIAGFSSFGLAGLTAADYLVDQFGLEETGHVTADSFPSITPFENGRPRHHTRLFSRSDLDVTILVNELFVPAFAAEELANAIADWAGRNAVDEIAVASGVPVAHGPDDHRVFYIATDDYRERRLDGTDVPAMGNGFLDGVNASLVSRGMDSDLQVGVFVTPVHAQAPDVEASIRLIETLAHVYDLDVDTAALEEFAAEIEQYYGELADRFEEAQQEQRHEERMFM